MSYGRSSKKQYEQPMPSGPGQKGKPGIKSKGKFEKDLISRATENAVRDKGSEGTK